MSCSLKFGEKAFSLSPLSILLAVGDRDIRAVSQEARLPLRQGASQAVLALFPSPQTESRWSHWVGNSILRVQFPSSSGLPEVSKLKKAEHAVDQNGLVLVT